MSQFNLARNKIEEIMDYNVLESRFENDAEQRRLKTSDALIGFKIQTPPTTKTQMQTYRDFFISKFGSLTSFTFTNPFDDIEYNVRFVRGSFRTIYQKGYFNTKFEFRVLSVA